MNSYAVAVTAVQDGNQSEPAQSKTFSFNSVKTVDLACETGVEAVPFLQVYAPRSVFE